MKCPLCGVGQHTLLLSLRCGNLDNSSLYDPLKVVSCDGCGHVFNELTEEDKVGLLKYYQQEYAPFNLQSPNKEGDTPGSSGHNSIMRYEALYDFIRPYTGGEGRLLDIGCAKAGFLKFLKAKGYLNLYGVDPSVDYISESVGMQGIKVALGYAESTGMDDFSFDIVVADQVVEHLFDPNAIFTEAKRILTKDGYLCISVPDASLYSSHYFFDFYWFLMREHIQHFDAPHLIALASKHGFSVISKKHTDAPFITDKYTLPNLSILFQYTGSWRHTLTDEFSLRESANAYIYKCKSGLREKQDFISRLSYIPFYVWGIGREFLYLYANTCLNSRCDILGLVDDIPEKQKHTVGGRPILPSQVLAKVPDANVFITAYAHRADMGLWLQLKKHKGKIL